MSHLMLDIETLGDEPGSIITSIGAVVFNPVTGETGATFHEHISVEDSIIEGFKPTGKTLLWWLQREQKARDYLTEGQKQAFTLRHVLFQFSKFVQAIELTTSEKVTVWGMGARFDCGLLGHAYYKVGGRQPWEGRNEICLRTLTIMAPHIRKNTPIVHVEHDALADCYHQINYGSQLYRLLIQEAPAEINKNLQNA